MDIQFSQFFYQAVSILIFYFPLGVIGLWRWSVWIGKELIARKYRPQTKPYRASVSVITPVYNEDPKVFRQALSSWRENKPHEIIAVIDYTDKQSIGIFRKFKKTYPGAKLIVTDKPGKRAALADGIRAATGEIVALVDSDTLWDHAVIRNGLPPFHDKNVAGVATRQNVLNPRTLAQKIFDMQLDLRYFDEYPFLAAAGDALVCLSGRTAFYRRSTILPMVDDLLNETFRGKPVISGDDKRLTYLVLAKGYKVAYQSTSHVFTPGMETMRSYMKQRLRWTRNALRADLRAMTDGWTWKHRALAFFQVDKILQTLTVLLSPIYFTVALIFGLWLGAAIIAAWWLISRTIKLYPHLRRRPQDIIILPAFILYTFVSAVIKVYAFFTLNTQGWITRWDTSRLPKLTFLRKVPSYAASVAAIALLFMGVISFNQYYIEALFADEDRLPSGLAAMPLPEVAAHGATTASSSALPQTPLVRRHVVSPGDTLGSIASRYGVPAQKILATNIQYLPNWNRLTAGTVLSIPREDLHLELEQKFSYDIENIKPPEIRYDEMTQTITIDGRGVHVTLADIQRALGDEHLKEIRPGVWNLRSKILVGTGATLFITDDEVSWLQLESTINERNALITRNGTIVIEGVKVTSWDSEKQQYDTNLQDGRSYILAKDSSRLDVFDAEIAYLGSARTEKGESSVYGFSYRMSDEKIGKKLLTGEIRNSKFHHNYFGAYTFGARGMIWQGNEFYENIRYGLDPHDDSDWFIVEHNKAYSNGSHGIIFSKRCKNNIIRGNISYNNKLHGIMLHAASNNNLIENNTIYGNTDGITIYDSLHNTIRNNTVYNNRESAIRGNKGSLQNSISNNKLTNNKKGIYLYEKADMNTISDNSITNNQYGLYIKTDKNLISNNRIIDNTTGVYFLQNAHHNLLVGNTINESDRYAVYTKTIGGTNFVSSNALSNNKFMYGISI